MFSYNICGKCGQIFYGSYHVCPTQTYTTVPATITYLPPNQACKLCGSTATDHTEKQCLKDRPKLT